MNVFAGLKLGKSCAGIVIVVFFEMLRAVFSARCFTIKLPNPRRYTFSFLSNKLFLIASIKDSTTAETSFLAMPVDVAISLMISAFVISFCSLLMFISLFSLHNGVQRYSFSA